ncbi:MAG: 16S rRNA (guanine(966)-N(2))-methyltransferase RsmD [Francisellaceae bacterium]|nr:16S rRNA (guanine(966)-N(2))-methyltransferase RsmD [Francisellaceae bacterium]
MHKAVRKKTNGGDVRIIAGFLKGRRISVLNSEGLRPTANRIREGLFNWLQLDVAGASCLDLFAGTGALGVEAISRGAEHVHFIEQDSTIVKKIMKICKEFAIEEQSTVTNTDALTFITEDDLSDYDIIFLDPPYNAALIPKLIKILKNKHSQAIIYLEDERDIASIYKEDLNIISNARAGSVYYLIATIK